MAERARMTDSASMQALAAGAEGIVAAWRGDVDSRPDGAAGGPGGAGAVSVRDARRCTRWPRSGRLELSVGNHAAAAELARPGGSAARGARHRRSRRWCRWARCCRGADRARPDRRGRADRRAARAHRAAPRARLGSGRRGPLPWPAARRRRRPGRGSRGVRRRRRRPPPSAAAALRAGSHVARARPAATPSGRSPRRSSFAAARRPSCFDEIGRRARWAISARAELERVGLHPGPTDQLTPAEARVAELAATGHTNREVASLLFVSTKTVEAHLARVYRKLGIRSRAELGRGSRQHLRDAQLSRLAM